MQKAVPPLATILGVATTVHVVDVGANPIDGDPPYKVLLDQGLGRVVGFEPNADALGRLNRAKGPHETYLPYAVGDGGRHTLHLCQAQGMTSLLTPDQDVYAFFHGMSDWGRVVGRQEVDTVRLDDVAEISRLDYLKIDIQGGELSVMENAVDRLSECVVIHTEVEFLPLYKDQPLFSEVEQFLRARGFRFHRFWPLRSRTIKPLIVEDDPYRGLSQVVDADAIFVRDFMRLDLLSGEQLLKLATIMHDLYQSFDLVLKALLEYDRREGASLASRYMGGRPIPL
jgi:FkbM family methyltransferase